MLLQYSHNMMLPPLRFTVGMVFFGLQASPSSSKHNDGHYGQTVLFLFHQTRGHFSKKYDLCPHVQLQTVVWLCTFFTKVRSSLGDRTRLLPEQYDSWVVPWCLYLRTVPIVCTDERGTFRNLEIAPKDEPDLFFSEVLADFFRFSHDVKQRGIEFEGRPWNISTGTPPIDSNNVS